MTARAMPIVPLSEMVNGQEADVFALMTAKQSLTTREGKPYFRVAFRDAGREVSFPVWDNAPLAADCREAWTPGAFYKIRAVYRETELRPATGHPQDPRSDRRRRGRRVRPDDVPGPIAVRSGGACSTSCWRSSASTSRDAALRTLVESILASHREALLVDARRAAQPPRLRRRAAWSTR